MFPTRTPSFTSMRRSPSSRINAFAVVDVQQFVQQEAIVEGVLHVSSAQARSCLERFEDLQHLSAPELPALSTVLLTTHPAHTAFATGSAAEPMPLGPSTPVLHASSSLGERVLREAFCIASPQENPVEDDGVLRKPRPISSSSSAATEAASTSRPVNTTTNSSSSTAARRQAGLPSNPASMQPQTQTSSSSSRGTSAATKEAVQRLEVAASQHASCSGMSAEVLRDSVALARSRRRKLLRLMRTTLAARDSIVAALHSTDAAQQLSVLVGSSLASLMSWEEGEDEESAVGVLCDNHKGCGADSFEWLEAMAGAPRQESALAALSEQGSGNSAFSVSEYTSWVGDGSSGCAAGHCNTCMHRLGPLCAKGH